MSICPTATAWRVSASPGRSRARAVGRLITAPPRRDAAQTWGWTARASPAHATGEISRAVNSAAPHWRSSRRAKSRSTRRWPATIWPA
jgi:hypothetical protein